MDGHFRSLLLLRFKLLVDAWRVRLLFDLSTGRRGGPRAALAQQAALATSLAQKIVAAI